jgi:hypothetical protein
MDKNYFTQRPRGSPDKIGINSGNRAFSSSSLHPLLPSALCVKLRYGLKISDILLPMNDWPGPHIVISAK